jgi:hypothetical protein
LDGTKSATPLKVEVTDKLNLEVDRNQSSIVFNDGTIEPLGEKKTNLPVPTPSDVPKKVTQQVGGNSTISFGEAPVATKTSVKVRVPPGGKSNFTLG